MRHEYHPEAFAELAAAQDWYEGELPSLGLELQEKIEAAIDHIKDMPGGAPRCRGADAPVDVRRYVLPRFPYAIAYFVEGDTVNIVAVAHSSRRPGYWLDRLP